MAHSQKKREPPQIFVCFMTLIIFLLMYFTFSSIPKYIIDVNRPKAITKIESIFNLLDKFTSGNNQFSFQTQDTKNWTENKTKYSNKLFHEFKTIYIVNRPAWFHFNAFEECSFKCKMMKSSKSMPKVDAVLFLAGDLRDYRVPTKTFDQVWVFVSMESPEFLVHSLYKWRKLFNWTMTYRRDSDMFFSHGSIVPKPPRNEMQINSSLFNLKAKKLSWQSKPFRAAWLVSNCRTKSAREVYSAELSKYIGVDKYGKCSQKKCPRDRSNCLNFINNRYKFYLSFENAFCRDYVTEKAYNIFRETNSVIPIVRGGANYGMYFPSNSYINADDFDRAKHLGMHLKNLANTQEDYQKYFRYQHYYEPGIMDQRHFCELCKRLHNAEKYARIYDDVVTWYKGSMKIDMCHTKKINT